MKRKGLMASHKRQFLRRSHGRCYYCRDFLTNVDAPNKFILDHVVPIKHGGIDDKQNILAVCYRCNSEKRAKMPIEYYEFLLEEGRPYADRVFNIMKWHEVNMNKKYHHRRWYSLSFREIMREIYEERNNQNQ